MEKEFEVVIVGGGLVGSLAALKFAKRGFNVRLFEKRTDIRKDSTVSGRSINLALSHRGLEALEGIPLNGNLIPMKGRMIHPKTGPTSSQLYGVFGEAINSVDRRWINQQLLDAAQKMPNVKLFFEHSLESADFEKDELKFRSSSGKSILIKDANLILGADGAYSQLRTQMMKRLRMDYEQTYIDHAYVELSFPPSESGDYVIASDHLHIWPRQTFMMIALPNLDRSFTVTLFMPWEKFNQITTENDLLDFFSSTFPDSIPLFGDTLVKDYFSNTKGPLISIKCKPYHYKNAVIVGDAAHAMVPFYGQGMNCGFEDLLVLEEMFDRCLSERPSKDEILKILDDYTEQRAPDAHAMCDLAMHNYIEMRSSVIKTSYIIRNKIERFLHRLFPKSIIPLYTMVSFTRIRYSKALEQYKKQTNWFEWGSFTFKVAIFSTIGVFAYKRLANYYSLFNYAPNFIP